MRFAVIGGDMRIASLAQMLYLRGDAVRCFALERADLPPELCVPSLTEAVRSAECVILPLPTAGRRGFLNAPLANAEHRMDTVLAALSPETLVCAGRVDSETERAARARGIELIDYFQREELAVGNAVATAEGAVSLIMQDTAITLWRSRVLVIGYGRVGKLTADRLRAMGAEVWCSARKCGDRAWIEAFGMHALDTRALSGELRRFDVVVNTVPAPILTESLLRELRPDTLCIDLASRPGGMDFAAAGALGLRAVWALSLPGEVAPISAGGMILDTIRNIVKERHEWKN